MFEGDNMMNVSVLKERLIEYLRTLSVCIPSKGDTQWTVRCPYCGDSIKDSTHGHLSIHIDVSSDDGMPFRCFRCNASGLVTEKFLVDDLFLSIDNELAEQLSLFNKRQVKFNNYVNHVEPKRIPIYRPTDWNRVMNEKISYLSKRIGVSETILKSKLIDLKIIVDFIGFCNLNNITLPSLSFNTLCFKNYNYIGFLSSNNNLITMRRIYDEDTVIRRYDKVIINPNNMNGNTFYNIPFEFSLLYTEEFHVHVAEGIFDILSVYFNLMRRSMENKVYFACCGFSYTTILKYLISNGINSHLIFHIYADNDKSDDAIRTMLYNQEHLLAYIDKIIIHRNIYTYADGSHLKDFGVPGDRINDENYELEL